MKHTPWKLDGRYIRGANGRSIAEWLGEEPTNAQFIVTACNSYDALRLACETIVLTQGTYNTSEWAPTGISLAVERAKIALAKAMGEG
uniref:Uncharacterized protein n=1 Tax=viral metagenome TaxID=1070528 RepID=A0A6M3M5E8_9ZZZZ